jgi:exosortase
MSSSFEYPVFLGLCLVPLVVCWQAIAATFSLALRQEAYTHILLVLPVSIALVVMSWNRHRWKPSPNIRSGIALLGLAALIDGAGLRWGKGGVLTGDASLAVEMLALVTWWIGSFVCCFGSRIFRACLFPLFFLFWLVPLPGFALSYVIRFLQHGTAACTYTMLAIVGVPVIKNGTILSIPGLTLQIVEECSSIRSSTMLIMSSMIMSYVLLRSYWARGIVVLAALPLAIFKNGLRVLTLALLGAYVSPEVLNSPLHRQGGVLFLAVSLLGMFALIWLVGKAENRTMGAAAS